MEDDATEERGDRLTRSAFWASAAFYVLVAFEFIYMATPFAAYVYSAYAGHRRRRLFCTTGPFRPSLLMGCGRTGPQNGWQTD